MPTHVRPSSWQPPSTSLTSSTSLTTSSCSYSYPSSSYPCHQQRVLHPQNPTKATQGSSGGSRNKRHFRFRWLCFRWPCFRFLSSRGATFRLLGAAVCACSLFHFIVHLFVADLFELLSGSVPLPVQRRECVRNLTWHVGPNLAEDDRRGIVVYSYPYLETAQVDTALTLHPRILWVPEQLIQRHLRIGRGAAQKLLNVTTMVRHLFNCSNTAMPLVLHIVNEEAVGRGETKWCLPMKRTTRSQQAAAKCKQFPSSCVKTKVQDKCRKVRRRQLRAFCLQHHPAVRLSSSWRLRHLPELLVNNNLKVLHLIGTPTDIHRNETSHVHFSSRTNTLQRLYHRVLLEPRRRAVCGQIKDDLDWIDSELSDLSAWFYQRFPLECLRGGTNAEGCILEMYNFLDIYVSDTVRRHAQEVANSSVSESLASEGKTSFTESSPFLDLSKLTEDETYRTLKGIQNRTCSSRG